MYSQNNEDDIIVKYFNEKPNGFFLEIGSFDPIKLSNTRRLVELGWSGIMIDMSPYCLVDLINEYKGNEKILIIGGAITAEKTSPMKAWLVPKDPPDDFKTDGAVSTTEEWHKNWWAKNLKEVGRSHVPYVTTTICLDELYEFLPSKVDFVSIDVEGTSFNLASKFDYSRFDVDAMVIEHDGGHNNLYNMLKDKYDVATLNAENIVFLKKQKYVFLDRKQTV